MHNINTFEGWGRVGTGYQHYIRKRLSKSMNLSIAGASGFLSLHR